MIVKEIYAKNILSKSKISDYTINPYIGCEHGCSYCYARFMMRYTKHSEKWGQFVDVKVNASILLQKEILKKRIGKIWISGVCDPYQPIERKYENTKKCLEILLKHDWPITIQTKSNLILRDIKILKKFSNLEVGITITTANDKIRQIFEAKAPPIMKRIETVAKLHNEGIPTFVMIAPLLPGSTNLVSKLSKIVNRVLIDKNNYHYADKIYYANNLEYALSSRFFINKKNKLKDLFNKEGTICQTLF